MEQLVYQEEYIRNPRGVQLFTCRWLPFSSPDALVFLCHGISLPVYVCVLIGAIIKFVSIYGVCRLWHGVQRFHERCPVDHWHHDEILVVPECGIRLARAGYAVFGIDYEGHGRSKGARCYIKKFENIVNDCYDFFKSVSMQEEYRNKCRFLYGESMGGAVALLLHKKDPSFWNGAVLAAPMCKISEKVKPHPVIVNILIRVVDIIPKWKIVPTKDVIDAAFKDPIKREEIRSNKLIYQDKPRLKTALEMLRTSMSLEESLEEVTLPFFVLHGEADTVTDPEVSRALYEQASSVDKTIKLYPGMWHGLTSGEPDENVEIVFADIIAWLGKHTSDDNAVTVRPTHHPFNNGIEIAVASAASAAKINRRKQSSSYLCGLRGRRRMFHHSAM